MTKTLSQDLGAKKIPNLKNHLLNLLHCYKNSTAMKKIPIGIQAFSSLIEGGFVYLDKTDMIYNIANTKACYFLYGKVGDQVGEIPCRAF